MEVVASTPKLVDPADVDAKGAPSATFPRADIEAALRDDAGADLFLEIARIQNGERDDRKIKVAWERSDLEALLQRASGDHVTLTFDTAELERLLDADVEAHGFREKALILTVAAATAAGMASQAGAQVLSDGGGGGSSHAAAGIVTDASTSGVPGSVASFSTDASTAAATGATSDDPVSVPADGWTNAVTTPDAAATPADGWTSAVESPVGSQPGVNVVTDNTGGQPGSVSGFATDATTSGQPGSVSGIASDIGSERTRTPAEPAVAGGGSGFSIPDSAIEGALAGGLALLITGAAFVTRTQRRREQPA
jgi:hypothetical protein